LRQRGRRAYSRIRKESRRLPPNTLPDVFFHFHVCLERQRPSAVAPAAKLQLVSDGGDNSFSNELNTISRRRPMLIDSSLRSLMSPQIVVFPRPVIFLAIVTVTVSGLGPRRSSQERPVLEILIAPTSL
jgi:hypothetical protein